jgi:RNA polymerase sigma-70 factor (ECF subfamily)
LKAESEASAPDAGSAPRTPSGLVEHFFRHETGRLHGALVRLMGVQHLALAEDVAQEAMLRALRVWSISGIPANPSAWITQVAMNLARDTLRRQRMSAAKEHAIITHHEQMLATPAVAWEAAREIRDDTLRLMFVCCHPAIAPDAQVILALKVLGGFSTAEIARAFLGTEAALEKQLTRTKQRIAEAGIAFELPEGGDLTPRLDGVLGTLYLMFNEGHKATAGDELLREDLGREAIRLTQLLVEHPAGNTPRTHALLALMLLTAARFPSRLDVQGGLLRLEEQDRGKWDQAMIARGLRHLDAAALHSVAPDHAGTDWDRILAHYDALLRLRPSPIVALNRAVAVAQVHGPQAGLDAIAAMPDREQIESHYLLHAVSGELHWRLRRHDAAAASFRRARALARVGTEQVHLERLLERTRGE